MAYWGKKLKYQIKPGEPFTIGGGENTYSSPFNIDKEEYSYSRNMTSRLYPSASVRPGCQKYATPIVLPFAFGQRNNEYIHVLDNETWKRWDGSYWQTVKTGLVSVSGKFIEFSTEVARYTALFSKTYDYQYAWDGTNVIKLTEAPCTNLVTVDDYRVYALDGTNLKCSAMGSITDWTTANDADTIALTSAKGTGTALATYNDTVIAWTEHSMHVLYGNDPYDFYLNDPLEDGCIANKSVIEHNGALYFLDHGAYKVYTGGRPQEISQPVKKYLDGINLTYKKLCAAGKQGKYIYLSIPYGSSINNLTLEYDTELDKWYPHSKGYAEFVNIGENLYGIDAVGQIYKLNTGTDDAGTGISWELITGVRNHGTVSQKKAISDFWLVADLPVNSFMTIYYSTTIDGNDFKTLCTFTGTGTEQNTRIQVPTTVMQNIDWYRLKIAGKGSCTIHYLEENFRIKAR